MSVWTLLLVLGLSAIPVAVQKSVEKKEKETEKKAAEVVRGNVQASKLIRRVEPVYPELAKKARVSQEVILQVTVDEQGNVADIELLRGHPLLNQSAIDAVQQWRYSPTLLNGEPVPVIATVTVNFLLRRKKASDDRTPLMKASPPLFRPCWPRVRG